MTERHRSRSEEERRERKPSPRLGRDQEAPVPERMMRPQEEDAPEEGVARPSQAEGERD